MGLSRLFSRFTTDKELIAVSGKLQQEINQGGGGSGAPIDETYLVHKTGDETVGGVKNFTSGISGSSFDTIEGLLKSNLVGFDEEFSPIFGDFYTSLDWTFGILYSGDARSLDWHLRETYTENFETSINWNSRELHASDGRSINWGLRELYTYNGDVAANWDNKALYGFYVEDFVNIIPVETLAWGQRQLLIGEANGFTSVNWEQGWLMSTGTNSSGASSNHMVANWFEGILYSMRDSHQPQDGEESPFVAHASVDWQNRKLYTVTNFGGEEFPDWQNELTLDWSGRTFHGEWGFENGSITAYGEPDEETGEKPVEGYLVMPGINGMSFEDPDGKVLASFTQRRLVGLNYDGFTETSLHWGNRTASDGHGNNSIRWNTRELLGTYLVDDGEFGFYPEAIVTINWSGRQLFDSGNAGVPTASLDWQERKLFASGESPCLDWDNRFMYNSEGNLSIDWEAGALANSAGAPSILYRSGQAYSVDNTMSIDWFSRDLRDVTGYSSLNWGDRELLGDWIVNPILAENSPPVDAATPQGWVGIKIQGSGDIVFKMPVYL